MVKEFKIRGEAYRTASIQGGNGEMDWEGVEGMYLMIRWMHWMGAGRRGQFVLCGCGRVESCRAAEWSPSPHQLLCRAPRPNRATEARDHQHQHPF